MSKIDTNCALLILDIQNDFTGKKARFPIDRSQATEIINNINGIIKNSEELKIVVVYIGNEYCILSPLNIFRNFAAISGSEGAKPDPRLIIINQNYFAKNKPDAFSNPKLIKFLNEHKINQVLITGVYAEACVFQTIKGAIKNGLQPILVRDGVGSKTQQKRQKYFEKYGEIVWMIDAHQIISYSEVTIVEPLPPWLMFPCPFSMAWRQGTGERWLHWEFRLFWDAMTPEQRQIYLTKWPIPDDDWYFFLFHEPRTTSDN